MPKKSERRTANRSAGLVRQIAKSFLAPFFLPMDGEIDEVRFELPVALHLDSHMDMSSAVTYCVAPELYREPRADIPNPHFLRECRVVAVGRDEYEKASVAQVLHICEIK